MKAKTKALAMVFCALLLVVATVFVTMAYFTSTTDVVKNTFTVGNVSITLDEADVDSYGSAVPSATSRVTSNEYKLIPGHSYIKDPTIHVAENSEDCYLFVQVTNDLAAFEDPDNTIAAQMEEYGWIQLTDGGIYYQEDAASAGADVPVFDTLSINPEETLASCAADDTIEVIAYAIQADGFADASAAWTAAGLDA